MTNVKSLLEMYVKMGGSLTDTYSDIAGGVPVGQYSTISDAILACSKKYSAGGGGAEKFIVTLTQDAQTEEWTADKTIAEIVAADAAGKIVVAKYPDNGMYVELPLNMAMEYQGAYFAMFVGLRNAGNDNQIVSVQCVNEGSGDNISVQQQYIPTSSTAPLIVTLTADQSTGDLVANKTYKEVYDAVDGGQTVTFKSTFSGFTIATNALSVGLGNDGYSVAIVFGGSIVEAKGAETDNVSFHVN